MAKTIKDELKELRFEFQLSDDINSADEDPCAELTEEEKQEYFMLKQLKSINTIKNCLVFLTSLTVISIVATVLFFLANS